MSLIMAYLGPIGTFSEVAATHFGTLFAENVQYLPTSSNRATLDAVARGEANMGVVPIENLLEGVVTQTQDGLIELESLVITADLYLPVSQNLLGQARQKLATIHRVYSHPQALEQCQTWLLHNLPGAEQISTSSTARAAQMVAQGKDSGECAIASGRAAQQYGLSVLREDVAERKNATRFILVQRRNQEVPYQIKEQAKRRYSLLLQVAPTIAGSLLQAIEPFYQHGINMVAIQTRPNACNFHAYRFFIDVIASENDIERLNNALQQVAGRVESYRLLGVYPSAFPLP